MPQGGVASLIESSATPLARRVSRPATDPRVCTTTADGHPSFYGAGMVDAGAAVS